MENVYYFFNLVITLMIYFVGITFVIGLLLQYIKPETVKRVLTKAPKGLSHILGSMLGAATPFCSCSTIPILVGLLKGGAPFGASMSFLIASPVLNPMVIGLLISLFGVKLTALYGVITFIAAAISGYVWERIGLEKELKTEKINNTFTDIYEGEDDVFITTGDKLINALKEAGKLFKQVAPYLLLGAAIGSIIRGFVPEELIIKVAGPDNPFAIPVAAVIGVPMYIRVSTMIPISAVLLEKGMGIGAVVALIIGGAGASIPEVSLLGAIFKRKLIFAFLLTVFTIAVTAGFLFTFS